MYLRMVHLLVLLIPAIFLSARPVWSESQDWKEEVKRLARGGAVVVADAEGDRLLALNPDKPFAPASILKIVTAAAALHYLGKDFRFTTDFRIGPDEDLYIVGRGDPYLISEELSHIAKHLRSKGLKKVRNILLDDRYFTPGLVLHGTSRSLNPYDAYNGALCVNFNTIYVRIGKNGKVASAEPQTPLTEFARTRALKSRARGKVRLNLSESPETCLLYAGYLFQAFLEQAGVRVTGRVARAAGNPSPVPLFYRHLSRKDLAWVVEQMFEYSNNFVANQIFLTLGAERFGPPAEAEKSRRAVADFLVWLGLPPIRLEEGSGLSRRTKITADQMIKVLLFFKSYRGLLPSKGRAWFKTGTLNDVKSMAGYLVPRRGQPLPFTIILNGKAYRFSTRDRILSRLEENLLEPLR